MISSFKKFLSKILSLALACVMCFGFVACTQDGVDDNGDSRNGDGEEVGCTHTYSAFYYNSEKHYKRPTCGCFDAPFGEVSAHEIQNGKCSVCNYQISSDLEFTLNSNGASYTLTGRGSCTDKKVGVPSTYNGHPVTAISSSAFKGDIDLESIVLPLGITALPSGAFANCYSLKWVSIPEGVKTLGSSLFTSCSFEYIDLPSTIETLGHGTFYKCSNLKEIIIPDKCTTITKGCFSECRNLKKVVIGAKVNKIGVRAFQSCTHVKDFYIKSVENWAQISFTTSAEDKEDDINLNPLTLNEFNSDLNVYANGVLLEELVIPDTVTKINMNTFCNIRSLKKIVLPKTLKEIDRFAFLGSANVTEVEFTGTIEEWSAVTKKSAWITMQRTSVVKCTDGEANLK